MVIARLVSLVYDGSVRVLMIEEDNEGNFDQDILELVVLIALVLNVIYYFEIKKTLALGG